jgi:hypothetical protein
MFGAYALGTVVLSAQQSASPGDRVPGFETTGLGAETDLREDDPFAPQSDGDSDLGEQFLLQRAPERTPIRLRFLSDAWWSNNLAATDRIKQEGWFWANYLEASWRPRLAPHLFLDSFAAQSVYKYEGGNLDFESTQIGLGVIKIFPNLDDLAVFGRYEYLYTHANNPSYRVLIGAGEHLTDHFHRLRFGTQKNLFIRPLDSAYAAADAAFNLDTDPSSLERNEYSFQIGYNRDLSRNFKTSLYYRAAWLDYQNSGREDWNQTIGIELSYLINDWARLHTSLFYANNDSNTSGGLDDYETFQTGIGIGLTGKF